MFTAFGIKHRRCCLQVASSSRETVGGLPAHVRLLPATTRNSTKVVIRNIPFSDACGQYETKQRLS